MFLLSRFDASPTLGVVPGTTKFDELFDPLSGLLIEQMLHHLVSCDPFVPFGFVQVGEWKKCRRKTSE